MSEDDPGSCEVDRGWEKRTEEMCARSDGEREG